MKPAVCSICGKTPLSTDGDGDWVEFLDYDSEAELTYSHPKGLEYFCGEHISQARCLDNMNASEALEKLNEIFSNEMVKTMNSKPEKR